MRTPTVRFDWNAYPVTKEIDSTNRSALMRLLAWAQYESGTYFDSTPRSLDDSLWQRVEPQCDDDDLLRRVFTEDVINIQYRQRRNKSLLSIQMTALHTKLTGPRYFMKQLFPRWEQHLILSPDELNKIQYHEKIVVDFKQRPLDRWRECSDPGRFVTDIFQLPPLGMDGPHLSPVKEGNLTVPVRNDPEVFTARLKFNHCVELAKSGGGNMFLANLHASSPGEVCFVRDQDYMPPWYVIHHVDYIPSRGNLTWRLYQAALWAPEKYHYEAGMGWKVLDVKSAERNTEALQDLILAALFDAHEKLDPEPKTGSARGAQFVSRRNHRPTNQGNTETP